MVHFSDQTEAARFWRGHLAAGSSHPISCRRVVARALQRHNPMDPVLGQEPFTGVTIMEQGSLDYNDRFPMHRAARLGHIDRVLYLLQAGTMVNVVDWDQISPLHEACLHGQLDCARVLIQNNALIDVPNIDGSTPLCEASANGSEACIQLLLHHGAKVNPPFSLSSPLHEAVSAGNATCIRLLLDAGAKLDASDCHFGTPLHIAAYKENLECARILLKAGASVNATHIHRSALHISSASASPASVAIALLLLDFGADVFSRDNQGQTARDLTPANTALHAVLYHYECNPRALQDLCRSRIRCVLGPKHMSQIHGLGLPRRLQDYLNHSTMDAYL